jgi:hypothetical protein
MWLRAFSGTTTPSFLRAGELFDGGLEVERCALYFVRSNSFLGPSMRPPSSAIPAEAQVGFAQEDCEYI